MEVNKIICGDALEVLKTLPDESINCCISSPPYWALRDYGVAGQLGLESTFEEYIDKLCGVYDEVKRVLRADGTCWVNLGDTYAAHKDCKSVGQTIAKGTSRENAHCISKGLSASRNSKMLKKMGMPDKSLCLIPQRFAIEMVNRGWILRNVIVWHKPNPMPSSAKDRFTVDFEYIFFFSKSRKYWFETQYEPQCQSTIEHAPRKSRTLKGEDEIKVKPTFGSINELPLGRNKRTTWTIPTEPCPEAHFATFPKKLVEPMIKAGCPEFVCKKCGKAREKIWETESHYTKREKAHAPNSSPSKVDSSGWEPPTNAFKGYTDCGCNAGFDGGIVLDPFCGTATVCVVAAQLKRNYIGIDINPEYVEKFAIPKTQAVETGVPVAEQQAGQIGLFEERK